MPLDFGPGMDFETAEGRDAIAGRLALHPDTVARLVAHGPPTPAELEAHAASPHGEPLDMYVVVERFWHGLHRVRPREPEDTE